MLAVVAVLSGATATIAGFGIGSMLTPLLGLRYGMSVAIAAVAIPHAIATAVRLWRLRARVEWSVVRSFGAMSAAGGLVGAVWYARLDARSLTMVLGGLLVLTSLAGLIDLGERWRPRGASSYAIGLVSGLFGGLAGNQGGLRSAALMHYGLPPATFVATATAIAAAVDAVRTPIYLWRTGSAVADLALPISIATAGVLAGTLLGERLLLGLSPARFRRLVSLAIGLLGVWLLFQSMR